MAAIDQDPRAIAALCRHYHIQRLAIFGSAMGDSLHPDSDLDVLVEFEPDHTPGFAFIAIQDDLTALFGRSVDLHTYRSLSRYFRDRVRDEARVLYAAG